MCRSKEGYCFKGTIRPLLAAFMQILWLTIALTAIIPKDESGSTKPLKRNAKDVEADDEDLEDEPVKKRSRRDAPKGDKRQPNGFFSPPAAEAHINGTADAPVKAPKSSKDGASGQNPAAKGATSEKPRPKPTPQLTEPTIKPVDVEESDVEPVGVEEAISDDLGEEGNEGESDDEEKPEVAAKAREKVHSTLKSSGKDPYPDWKAGEPVPYAALCTTFSLIEMTSKRLLISAHCSLFLRQVLRLHPSDLLPTVQLMINKLAADYAGIELGIGESLIMKAIGETTGRSLAIIKHDQSEIGDLGLVAAKSRSSQPTMFKPKALTVKGVWEGLMGIATVSGDGSQGRKIAGIKKLLSAADVPLAGKGSKGTDITKNKGGASETKFIIRFLEGKLRLGLAEKTVLVALAHAVVIHETEKKGKNLPSTDQLAKGEAILKTVYR